VHLLDDTFGGMGAVVSIRGLIAEGTSEATAAACHQLGPNAGLLRRIERAVGDGEGIEIDDQGARWVLGKVARGLFVGETGNLREGGASGRQVTEEVKDQVLAVAPADEVNAGLCRQLKV
jgi:hypothetical protein